MKKIVIIGASSGIGRRVATDITRGRRVATIDSRWRIVDTLWRLIPGWAWRRIGLTVGSVPK